MRPTSLAPALLLLLLGACRTIEDSSGFLPILEYNGRRDEYFFRPLFSVAPNETRVVWPLFRNRLDDTGRSWWLMPLMVYRSRVQEMGLEKDFYLIPFIACGDSPTKGSHFAFFPFYGTIKGFLAQDEFYFVLWPAYMRFQDRNRYSHHVVWPFVNWIEGERFAGWRLWPFWATYSADTIDGVPKYRRQYIIWPFFSHQRNALDSPTPSTVWSFFPFYSQSVSKNITHQNIMWPFYAYIEDRKKGYSSCGTSIVPIRFTEGKDRKQFDLWPFFGWWRLPWRTRQFALWPIQRYEREKTDQINAERLWVLPFWWQSDVSWPLDKKSRLKRRKLWPFFSYEVKDEDAHWEFLSLIPWFDEETDQFWGRLWQLARYRRSGPDRSFEFLWGLYSWEDRHALKAWRVAGGLFGVETDAAGETTYRVLFIPF